jgi:hypothetical protein
VGRGDHAEGAFDFRPGGEWIGIDVAQRLGSFSLAGSPAVRDHNLVRPERVARVGG